MLGSRLEIVEEAGKVIGNNYSVKEWGYNFVEHLWLDQHNLFFSAEQIVPYSPYRL